MHSRPGAAEAEPADDLSGGEFVVLHEVATDASAGAAEAGLAVHGERALLGLAHLEEALEDGLGGVAAIGEVHVVVVEARVEELLAVVHLVVEAHDARHIVRLEVLIVRLGRVRCAREAQGGRGGSAARRHEGGRSARK